MKRRQVVSPTYLKWVREQPCYFGDESCPTSHAHHYPPKGRLGYTDDLSALPVCWREHARCHGETHVQDGRRYLPIPEHEQHFAVLVTFWRFWRTANGTLRRAVLDDLDNCFTPSVPL